MTPSQIVAAEACAHGADAEQMSFPATLARLADAGIEHYHADLLRAEKTFYAPGGSSHVVAGASVAMPFARAFDPEGVVAALRAIQRQEIGYRTFCDRIAAAGCTGYIVSLPGRRAVYWGRTGESYVEMFPPQD
jgi:uncharacterized protein YbcV (DUF1398 family)